MPQFSSKPALNFCFSRQRLTRLSQAIVIATSSALLLGGCGSDSPTTRVSNTPAEQAPEATIKLTVRSAVQVKNAVVRLLNVANGEEIAKKTINDGTEVSFDIETKKFAGRLLVAELLAADNSSSYFDPVLGKFAPFTTPLHVSFTILNTDGSININPFTEIAYQRALVRAGSVDNNSSNLNQLDAKEVVSVISSANNEVFSTFRVSPTMLLPSVGSMADLKKLVLDPEESKNPPNSTAQYLNIFYGLGHFNLQHQQNPNDPTPLLSFTQRAAKDMRDGSLDGMTLAGEGINGTVFLANPLVSPQIVNDDPNQITKEDFQKKQDEPRKNYADNLESAIVDYLEDNLRSTDKAGIEYFKTVNYLTGEHSKYNLNMPSLPVPRSLGAGNYSHAFGLSKVKRTKGIQYILNSNCERVSIPANPDAGKEGVADIYDEVGCRTGVRANNASGTFNPIENLVGTYTTADNNCKLSLQMNGRVILSQGSQTFSSNLNGYESDAIIRLEPKKENYLLNVASIENSPPGFIQIRIENQRVISAAAGVVNSNTINRFPRQLDQVYLNCQGFKPVFIKPVS